MRFVQLQEQFEGGWDPSLAAGLASAAREQSRSDRHVVPRCAENCLTMGQDTRWPMRT